MKFEFKGKIKSYDCEKTCQLFTDAISAKQAIKNFIYQGKKLLNLVNNSKAWLVGTIYVNYGEVCEEIEINNDIIKYEIEINYPRRVDKYEFENELLTREQILCKLHNSRFEHNTGNTVAFDYTHYLEHDGKMYIYDNDEEVYWVNGERFSDDYIIRKDI